SGVSLLRLSEHSLSSIVSIDRPTPALYTLSLHDALPISASPTVPRSHFRIPRSPFSSPCAASPRSRRIGVNFPPWPKPKSRPSRSEEHTSELQSRFDLVCRLLLEKKNTVKTNFVFMAGRR